MYNLKAQSLFDHVDCFRNIMFNKTAKDHKEGETYEGFIKRILKLNKEKDWGFICSGMDLIGDTCFSIDHFIKFGLEGVSRYNEVGEKYLRLYGVLNSTYIQQGAVYSLLRLCQVVDQSCFKEKIDSLEIRNIRHKLGAHSIDYMDENSEEIFSFVPVRSEMCGFHCNYTTNNNDDSTGSINLLNALEHHLDLMIEMVRATILKTSQSLYKTNPAEIKEIEKSLEKLKIEGNGGFVHDKKDGVRVIFSTTAQRI